MAIGLCRDKHDSASKRDFGTGGIAKGSGFLEILNSNEEVIYRKDVPGFYTWTYQYTWNGKDSQGMTVPDGLYIARFTAEDQVRELAFKVDRSIFYHLTDLTGAGTGIGSLPMAISMPEKSAVFDISLSPVWETGTGFYSLPFSFGLRAWPVKGFELSGKFTAFCCQDEKLTAVPGSEDEESQTPVVLSGCAKFAGETGYYLKFTYGACIHYGYCNVDNLIHHLIQATVPDLALQAWQALKQTCSLRDYQAISYSVPVHTNFQRAKTPGGTELP